MKKLSVLLLLPLFILGCAAPQQKAEKLAQKIEKETLAKESGMPAMPAARDEQPRHAAHTIAAAIGTPAKLALDGIHDTACMLVDFTVWAPGLVLGVPLQAMWDLLGFAGEIGKFVFPPTPPRVE